MSRPPTFVPPPCATARTLRTARGDFAVLDAVPPRGVPVAGTVLMLPGFTGSKEDFIALLEPIAAAGYRAVTVDGRGQYETAGPDDESAYAQEELARDALAQAAALGDETSAGPGALALLGHSLGGQVARAAVLLAPGTFSSLTLMSSGPAAITPTQQTRATMLADAVGVLSMDEVWQAMRAMEPPPPQDADTGAEDSADDSEALRARWLRHNPAQLIATARQLCTEQDRVDELAATPPPKHVLSGERDDTWPVPLLDDMAHRLRAHRSVIAGAEHSPNTDRPAQTAAALIAFWDRHRA
ncbi:alpha/beta fold hydrolase [Streptomyces kanamyceticus]|uniref:Alpha/beta hydrolase n=1 Tax=Streptomyces kanamyceticus TaxID=1967 RepID=A0A5J6G889_STRKN|nr:alpha/beta hydrolase [Streptomyces kanamyceticus]QEU92000.1 alpha/beta hydrolase [Streptomyces kanamyceticus]